MHSHPSQGVLLISNDKGLKCVESCVFMGDAEAENALSTLFPTLCPKTAVGCLQEFFRTKEVCQGWGKTTTNGFERDEDMSSET